jgi:hypothetical protein
MARQEELKNVPADGVDQKVQDYKDAGATNVEKTKQSDGSFTITATFDDESDGDEKSADADN